MNSGKVNLKKKTLKKLYRIFFKCSLFSKDISLLMISFFNTDKIFQHLNRNIHDFQGHYKSFYHKVFSLLRS